MRHLYFFLFISWVAPVSVAQTSTSDENEIAIDEQQVSSNDDEKPWIDSWQQELTESMDSTAQQLDRFFSINGTDTYKEARAEGRVRLGWEPRTRNLGEMDLRFRVRVKLPALKDRVDLVLSDDENTQNDSTIKAARTPVTRNRDNTTIALRYQDNENSRLSHRIGTGRRGQIYVKSRFQDKVALNRSLGIYYDAELYYYNRDQLGAEIGATLQWINENEHVFRFNNRYYYRDEENEWLWRHEIQFLQPLTTTSAGIYTLFAEGYKQPKSEVSEVYTSFRYRANPTREWLFYEVEPFILWLREEDFKPSWGLALRVEMYYGNNT